MRRPSLLFSLIILLSSSSHAQSTNNNDALWSDVNYNLYALLKSAGYGPGHFVQLSAFPVAAAWGRPAGKYSLYLVADNVPEWSPTWTFSRRRLDDAYGVFLDAIDVEATLSPTQRRELRLAENAWKGSRNRYAAEVDKIKQQWEKESAKDPRLNRQDWMRLHVASAVTARNSALRDFLTYKSKVPPDYQTIADMLERYTLESTDLTKELILYPPTIADAANQNTADWPSVRLLSFFGSADQLGNLITTGDTHATDANWPKPQFSIGTTHSVRDEERTMFGGSVSFGGFFGFISAGGSSDNYKITDSKSEFSLKFEALGIASIPIGPSDSWYAQYVLTHYACGPFKKKGNGQPAIDPAEYWKDGGLLSLIPTSVMVAYKPIITVHLGTSDFEEVSKRIEGSAGFSIGPFSIGGGGSQVKKHTTVDTTNHNIILNFDSPDPMIMGVVSERLNAGKTCP